jgi:NAD(P)-dependent dehydrogenase (short-subunit alcohol dehydrogenase family)
MRALVIGGTQFMGRAIVRRLLERGHEVTVLHRGESHDLGPTVGNLRADRGDFETVRRLLQGAGFQVVFDLAYDWEKGTTADQVEAAARAVAGPDLHRYVFTRPHLDTVQTCSPDLVPPQPQHESSPGREYREIQRMSRREGCSEVVVEFTPALPQFLALQATTEPTAEPRPRPGPRPPTRRTPHPHP